MTALAILRAALEDVRREAQNAITIAVYNHIEEIVNEALEAAAKAPDDVDEARQKGWEAGVRAGWDGNDYSSNQGCPATVDELIFQGTTKYKGGGK